jgi:Kef-type K+ transport system membrane component KefB
MRPRLRAVLTVGGMCIVIAILLISVACFFLARFLPFMADMDAFHRAVVSLTMGVVLAALSPTVTLALLNETGSEGPISETILGIVVLADLAIIFSFAAVNALANSVFGSVTATTSGGAATELVIHIFGSLIVGSVLGMIFAFYLKKVNQRVALFIFGVCFLSAEAGVRLHLDPLLMCLAAGLFLENLTDIQGAQLIHDIESASMPVFAVFFAVAGAGLHWDIFRKVAVIAIILAAVRAVALLLAARVGMAMGRVPSEHRGTIPFGLLSQSGIAIGLSVLVEKHFAGWGKGASTCLFGAVMLNEMIGPVLFRNALMKSGEAGRKAAVVGGH